MPTRTNWESVSSVENIFPLKKWKQTISCHGQKAEKPNETTVKCSANNATAEKAINRKTFNLHSGQSLAAAAPNCNLEQTGRQRSFQIQRRQVQQRSWGNSCGKRRNPYPQGRERRIYSSYRLLRLQANKAIIQEKVISY